MNALLALVLAAPPQPLPMVPGLPAPPAPTAIPSTRFECHLRKDDGTDIRFGILRGGGEALRVSGAILGARLAAEVTDDPDKVLAGYTLDAWGETIFGHAREGLTERSSLSFGEAFQILVHRTGQEAAPHRPTRVAIRLEEHRAPQWGMHPYVRAVGFCDTHPGPPAPSVRASAKEPGQ